MDGVPSVTLPLPPMTRIPTGGVRLCRVLAGITRTSYVQPATANYDVDLRHIFLSDWYHVSQTIERNISSLTADGFGLRFMN